MNLLDLYPALMGSLYTWINLTPAIESLFELELRDFIAAVNDNQISYKEAFTAIYNLYTLKLKLQE